MPRKCKSLNNYSSVKKKSIIKNKSFNNCRELLKNHLKKIIMIDTINPLFLYYNSKKNIKVTEEVNTNMNKETKKNKILETIKLNLDQKTELNNDKQLVIYKPPDNKNKLKNINQFMLNINSQLNRVNNESNKNIFKPKFILRPKRRYKYKDIQRRNFKYPPPPIPPKIKKEKISIEIEINNIDDLIQLMKDYPLKSTVEYNINMEAIHNIKSPLVELNSMIGMRKLKQNVVDQILYFIQDLHKISNSTTSDYMHTVIYGPPGTGKTETAKIMGKIFSGLGVLKKNKFMKVTRADLIAGYLGQTALKTQEVIKDSLGGVLFIDEAYALGNMEKRDSFAKECIDTLCEGLSDHKDDLMVIIAGYKDELEKCFFAYNSGLTSRFTWRFKTDDYTYEELFLILKKKVSDINWKLSDKVTSSWFKDKKDDFKFYGRDIETFLSKAKICHSKRVFCLPKEKKTILTKRDLNKAFDLFKENNSTDDESKKTRKEILDHMYV